MFGNVGLLVSLALAMLAMVALVSAQELKCLTPSERGPDQGTYFIKIKAGVLVKDVAPTIEKGIDCSGGVVKEMYPNTNVLHVIIPKMYVDKLQMADGVEYVEEEDTVTIQNRVRRRARQ
ncbi:hypothetical protein IWQ61_009471 [Dispira simplex]|nr:hypothetical protein IWQ61_009471 [Dispira simplex]